MPIQPYLFFDGRCEEALEFYRRTLGAEVTMLMRYEETPEGSPNMAPPGWDDKVLHASFRVGKAELMASDDCMGAPKFGGFSLSLPVPDVASAERTFAALGEGGEVRMPLTETFFSPRFGMLADRFGVPWMVMIGDEGDCPDSEK